MDLQSILKDCDVNVNRYEPVHGGDINEAWHLYGDKTGYFLKVNNTYTCPGLFEKEKKGLNCLRNNCTLLIPAVIKTGNAGDDQYLLLEWIETGNKQPDFWKNFGSGLAGLHKREQPFFGWEENNYIGTLLQDNTRHAQWHSFYTECRILPLVKKLYQAGLFSKQDVSLAENVCNKMDQLFPIEKPALLHGDLWSGNFKIASNGSAAIYDPAVYYGHREMDLAMTLLFGGFDPTFYDAYQEMYPLEKGWQQRLPLTQLYPLLVHAVLFGGNYVSGVKGSMKLFQ